MKKIKTISFIIGTAIIILSFLFLFIYRRPQQTTISIDPANLAGIQRGNAPWLVEITNLKERLTEIGLPTLSQEGTVLHTHEHLDIFVHGQKVSVPADIGVNDTAGFVSPIHTHDETAIIHVESPVSRIYTLGQFFDIWGVYFTKDCIGGYCTGGKESLKIFVDGGQFQGDPRLIALKEHEEIAIIFGNAQELPNPIPSSFNFPAGY